MLMPREKRRASPMAAAPRLRDRRLRPADPQLTHACADDEFKYNRLLLLHYPYCHTSRLNLFSLGL